MTQQERDDLVLLNGRVRDRETQLDAPGSVGIQNRKITAVSREPLAGPRIAQRESRLVASKDKHVPQTYGIIPMDLDVFDKTHTL